MSRPGGGGLQGMSTDTEPQIVELPVATTAVVRGVVPVAELSAFFDRAFPTVVPCSAARSSAGPGSLYHGARALGRPEVGFVTDRAVEPTDGSRPAPARRAPPASCTRRLRRPRHGVERLRS